MGPQIQLKEEFDMHASRTGIVLMALLLLAAWRPSTANAQGELDYWQVLAMDRVAFRMKTVALMPATDEPGQIMVYGDRYGYLRANQVTGDGTTEIWRSRTLDGEVYEVMVEDLDGDGRVEILCRTKGGRIYVYDDSFNPRWENLREDYQEISAMALANMDDDPAYEMVILGDGHIDYIDGKDFTRQYRSTQTYQATELAVGNVDSDANLEIVLNTGLVLDGVRLEPKWSTDEFGSMIELLDIDGDGIEEILGYDNNGRMMIYEADQQQEKPVR
jgi:hypothetical protein